MIFVQPPPANRREFLFHFQICGSDITAKQLGYLLVEGLTKAPTSDVSYLSDHHHQRFWVAIVSNKLYQLDVDSRVWIDPEPSNPFNQD